MNFRRLLRMLLCAPNSSKGLIIRAERLEDRSRKERNAELSENGYLYAEILRQLAGKKLTPRENEKFIEENVRKGGNID